MTASGSTQGPHDASATDDAPRSGVEVTVVDGEVTLRDSKQPFGPVLRYTPAEWRAFLDGVKTGEFDDIA
jgi:Domain of unknown function (DUF397)